MFFVRVLDRKPVLEYRRLPCYSVIVNLVSSTNHDMEWTRLMSIENVSPQRVRSAEMIGIDGEAKSVATVEHDVH